MGLSVGIVGLPNVGKSTLFNALTKNKVDASNYPFCTIEPNIGVVAVPDIRLEKLAKVVRAKKIVPAVVEFVDIAGIVKGAYKGEGLGNKFLSNIRECDCLVEVLRCFGDKNVTHVGGTVNPLSDLETIKTELILKDLETVENFSKKLEKEAKKDSSQRTVLEIVLKIAKHLNLGEPVRNLNLEEEKKEVIKPLNLLTIKPHIYVLNVSEEDLKNKEFSVENSIKISAKTEAVLADLPDEEVKEFLKELGQEEKGLDILIKKAYKLLGLETFFTAGEPEVRAWTFKKGVKAPEAAGVIHTDFQKGFIKADVINWEDLINAGGWQKAREEGKVRLEGKDYVVQDGDVMIFKFQS